MRLEESTFPHRSNLKRFSAICVAAVLAFGLTRNADSNHVVMHGGPFLGVVIAIAVDPNDPANVYCAAYGGGVFRSQDRGASWTAVNQGLPDRQVFTLAIHPADPSLLYVGTDQGIYYSIDRGTSWKLLTAVLSERNIRAVVIIPGTPDILYAATDQGVFQGSGEKWTHLARGLLNRDVRSLVVSREGNIFAGTFGGVFKMKKGRGSWEPMNSGLNDKKVRSLALDPAAPNRLYAGTASGGVFESIAEGRRWKDFNKGLLNSTVLSLLITPAPHKALYAATIVGVFKNQGSSGWIATDAGLAFTVPALAFNPRNPRNLYAGSGGHLFKTTDAGAKWQEVSHQVNYFGPVSSSEKQ
jgi:photosystem II stability/assembly factor-like uncharacterized protein